MQTTLISDDCDRLFPASPVRLSTGLLAEECCRRHAMSCGSTPSNIKVATAQSVTCTRLTCCLQQAEAQVYLSQQSIAQTENQISILLGRNPGPIARGLALVDQPHLAVVPTGLPSALLERRPDVRQSEATLVAANANVGVAKADFLPADIFDGAVRSGKHCLDQLSPGAGDGVVVGWRGAAAAIRGRCDHECLQTRLGTTQRGGVDL